MNSDTRDRLLIVDDNEELARVAKRSIESHHGSIDRVYGRDNAGAELEREGPTGAVHLLIGWADKVGQGTENLEDGGARWVSIGHVTGRITTTENAEATTVSQARQLAVDAQGMGAGA